MNWNILKNGFPYMYAEFKEHVEDNNIDASEGEPFHTEIKHFLHLKGYATDKPYQKDIEAQEIKFRILIEPLLKGLPLHIGTENIVKDITNISEFAHKYRKPERFTERGEEYVKCVLETHKKEVEENGYTAISMHDNILGKYIVFVPPTPPEEMVLIIGAHVFRVETKFFAEKLHAMHLSKPKYAIPLKAGMLSAPLIETAGVMLKAAINENLDKVDQELFKLRVDDFIKDVVSTLGKEVIKMADIVV